MLFYVIKGLLIVHIVFVPNALTIRGQKKMIFTSRSKKEKENKASFFKKNSFAFIPL